MTITLVMGGFAYLAIGLEKENAGPPTDIYLLESNPEEYIFIRERLESIEPAFAQKFEEDVDGKEVALGETYHLSFVNDHFLVVRIDGRIRLDGGGELNILPKEGHEDIVWALGVTAPLEEDISDMIKESLVEELGFESPISDKTFNELVYPFIMDTAISDDVGTGDPDDVQVTCVISYMLACFLKIGLALKKLWLLKKQVRQDAA